MDRSSAGSRWTRPLLAIVAISAAVLLGVPAASADHEAGHVDPIVAPPVPPEEAGNPQPITIGLTQIPPVPPHIEITLPAVEKPKCKAKGKRAAATAKKCKRKKRRAKRR